MKNVFTANIKIEKIRRLKFMKDFVKRTKLDIYESTLLALLEVSMDDAYRCGRIEKSKEIEKGL